MFVRLLAMDEKLYAEKWQTFFNDQFNLSVLSTFLFILFALIANRLGFQLWLVLTQVSSNFFLLVEYQIFKSH